MKKLLLINLIVLSLFAADDKNDLMRACIEGNIKQMQALLDAGADVNKANGQGRTPLYEASFEGKNEVAGLLISAGADVDKADIYGWTPLHQASDRGHEEIVEMLLIGGADKTKANNKGDTAVAIAKRSRKYAIAQFIEDAPRVLSLQQLTHDEVPDNAGEDVNKTNDLGRTPLNEASFEGEKEVVEMLVDAGADVNIADNYGWTPLHQACDRGHKEIVEMLLISGADKTIENENGETAIAIANRNREYVIAKLLANSPRVLSLQQLALKIVRENQVPHDGVPDDAFENLVNETYNRAEKVMDSSA